MRKNKIAVLPLIRNIFIIPGFPLIVALIKRGELKNLFIAIWCYLYREFYEVIFFLKRKVYFLHGTPLKAKIKIQTKYPVAYKSPDHIIPWGTKHDNSTHKKFLLHMEKLISLNVVKSSKSIMDLGCSGGQLVKDFRDMGWVAVGLEGSDYSLKNKRANWPELAGKSLFTCDIAKPFQIFANGKKHRFQLITAWEVLEHIRSSDLPILFNNIIHHLDDNGYFMASTTSLSDIHGGIDLHQTKMTNTEWHTWIARNVPELKRADVGLKFYQYVRYNFERSFLVYIKR